MASLWKHPNSPYWTACFTDKEGRRRKRSTKETSHAKAMKLAEKYEEAARKRRTFSQVREVLHELHKEMTGEQLKIVSLRAHIQNWLAEKRVETSAATLQFYTASTDKVLAFFGERADQDICEVTRDDVVGYRDALAGPLSPTSVNHHLKCLRMVFKAAKRARLLVETPTEFVDGVKKSKGGLRKRIFTIPELKAIIQKADPEWQSMIIFGIYTGQRLSDIAALMWSCINFPANAITLTTAKTSKNLIIPIAPPLLRHLKELQVGKDPSAAIHPRAFTSLNKSYKTSTLSNQFGNILAAAGLREKVSHKKEKDGRQSVHGRSALSFHSLRHTAVTMLKDAGNAAAVVMELIGHDSKQMSEHYTHVSIESMQKAANSLPDLTAQESAVQIKKKRVQKNRVQVSGATDQRSGASTTTT